jgi:hypothetical protein
VLRARDLLFTLPLLSVAAFPATAQAPLNLGLLVICSEMKDDSQRLQCYDKLVADTLKTPAQAGRAATVTNEQDWRITESKSPVDDSAQVAAVLEAAEGNAALIIRCHDRMSDAFVNLRTFVGVTESLRLSYRINQEPAVETRWQPARSGDSVFVPTSSFFSFVRGMPDEGDLFIRLLDFQGRNIDLTFKLGPISEVRDLLGTKCNWPAEQRPPATRPSDARVGGTAPIAVPSQPRRSSGRVVSVPQQAQRWNVTSQRR